MQVSMKLSDGTVMSFGVHPSLMNHEHQYRKLLVKGPDYYHQTNIKNRLKFLEQRRDELLAKAPHRWYSRESEYTRICKEIREHLLMLDSDIPL